MTLTTVSLLATHLADDNHEALLDAARHKSKRDVERLVASLDPQPDIASSLRRIRVAPQVDKATPAVERPVASIDEESAPLGSASVEPKSVPHSPMTAPPAAKRAVVAPLSPERYLLKVTLSEDAHVRLARIRDLLRHTIPNGDPAAIIDRALTVLLDQLEKTKYAATRRPKAGSQSTLAGQSSVQNGGSRPLP